MPPLEIEKLEKSNNNWMGSYCMGLRTIVLKLHKPGKGKREMLDQALENYNKAFQFLLRKAYANLDDLQAKFGETGGKFAAITLSKLIDKKTLQALNQFHVQPFKDSLQLDFGMALASNLRLRESEPGTGFFGLACRGRADHFACGKGCRDGSGGDYLGVSHEGGPSGILKPAPHIASSYSSDDGLHLDRTRPVYFCRYDVKRCYSLLYDREKDKYYAKLYIANREHARNVPEGRSGRSKLSYICSENRILERSSRKETFIVVPLSFGRWQEKWLKEALQKPDCLRTAKLYKREHDYYLAVTFDTGEPESIHAVHFMGVSRGLKNKLNYTILDQNGEVVSEGAVASGAAGTSEEVIVSDKLFRASVSKGRQPNILQNELHGTANLISDIAQANKARVIVQNLTGKGDGITKIVTDKYGKRPAYGIREYNQLTRLLEYKLVDRGLPSPVRVSSVDIFTTCHNCGHNSKSNIGLKGLFICTACGATMEMDKLGSFNLAGKLLNYKHSQIKIKVTRTNDGVLFSNDILGLKCLSSNPSDHQKRLTQELSSIIEDTLQNARNRNKAKISMVKKLTDADNIMDMIKYV